MLPCLTPAQQFLETVIIAASSDPKPEDQQDLVWMKDNLKMDILSDSSTLKKTWADGKVTKVIDTWPMMRGVFIELGLVTVNDDDSVRSVSQTLFSGSKYRTDLIAAPGRIKHVEPKPFKVQPLIQHTSRINRVAFPLFLNHFLYLALGTVLNLHLLTRMRSFTTPNDRTTLTTILTTIP